MSVIKLPKGEIIPLKEDYTHVRPVIQINFDRYETNEENKSIIKKSF